MQIIEIPKRLYTAVTFIYSFDKEIRESRKVENIEYLVTKEEKKLMKKIYNTFKIYENCFYKDFKRTAIEMAISQRQDIIWATMKVVEIIKDGSILKTIK